MLVTLTSSRTAVAQVPACVTVAAGETTATFTIATAVTSRERHNNGQERHNDQVDSDRDTLTLRITDVRRKPRSWPARSV